MKGCKSFLKLYNSFPFITRTWIWPSWGAWFTCAPSLQIIPSLYLFPNTFEIMFHTHVQYFRWQSPVLIWASSVSVWTRLNILWCSLVQVWVLRVEYQHFEELVVCGGNGMHKYAYEQFNHFENKMAVFKACCDWTKANDRIKDSTCFCAFNCFLFHC